MNKILNLIFKLRAQFTRFVKPSRLYLRFKTPIRKLDPISGKFGFDRGTPIDRYWIELFLEKNRRFVSGVVLEITDPKYTKIYGGSRVTRSDVLDVNPNNPKANIIADLKNLKGKVKDNTYDCIILTHVLGLIDDYASVIKELKRILKPGGALLFTGSCLGPILKNNDVYWRFTKNSVTYIFNKFFEPKSMVIQSYGNALTGQAFWVGMSQEDLTKNELNYTDERFPCVVSAVIVK